MAIVTKEGTLHERPGTVEYIMSQQFANEILKTRKGMEKNMPPQQYLVKYANEELGLLNTCVKVTTK